MANGNARHASAAPSSGARKLLFLGVPWLFLGLLGYVAWHLILPAIQHGAFYGYILAPIFLLVGSSFGAAAVTTTRDLLAGRFP